MAFSISGSTGITENNVDAVLGAFLTSQVVFLARNTAPNGFLKCNGAAISRTTYANLFAAIGTTFGVGDGSTTFNLPDLRGEFIRCWDDGKGTDSGRTFASWQDSDNKQHDHAIWAWTNIGAGGGTGNFVSASGQTSYGADNDNQGVRMTGGAEARPRNTALLACIKY